MIVMLAMACSSDPCTDSSCGDHGTCIDGACMCDEGYEGDNCEREEREKFLGEWKSDNYGCGGNNSTDFGFTIKRGRSLKRLVFEGHNSTVSLDCTYEGHIITIPYQKVGSSYYGMLTLTTDKTLALELMIDNGITDLSCRAIAMKQ